MDSHKSLEAIRTTLSENKKQMNETNKHVQEIEKLFFKRQNQAKEIDEMLFQQREALE